jgi:hypothetical protein
MIMKKISLHSWFYLAILAFWLISVALSLSQTGAEVVARYSISGAYLLFLKIGFSVPMLLMWLMIAYAALSFNRYSEQIIDFQDGKGFKYIGQSLFILLFSGIFSNYVSQIGGIFKEIHGSSIETTNTITIVQNYFVIFLALLAYIQIFRGARVLLSSINKNINWKKVSAYVLAPLGAVAIVYLWLIFNNQYRTSSDNSLIRATYALPDILILFTVAVPYLVSWFFGLTALFGIVQFSKNTSGVIYKASLNKFVAGISIVIILTIILQFITQFGDFWSTLGFGSLIAVVSVIFIIIIIGYYMVASGAYFLEKLENI